jgi:hypothetical protein
MKLNCTVIMLLPLLFITFGTVHFTQPTSAEVKVIDIGLYWDEECSMVVSLIDFGTLARGQSRYVTFWLRNDGTEKGRISWDSGNFNPSSNGITECWERKVGKFRYISSWNKKMKTGDLGEVHYTIQVAQDLQVGVYSWNMMVYYVSSHKVSCLFVFCILTITQ